MTLDESKELARKNLKERDDTIFSKDVKSWMLSGNDINITFKDGNELVGAIYEHRKDSEDKKAECFLCEDLTSDYTGDYFIVEVYNGKISEIKFQSYDWLEHYMDDSYDLEESKKSVRKTMKEAKTVTCISCEKNLNDYRNDPTCTQTWDYADGDTKWYQKSIHACIDDAKKFMKKGYLCYIDGELFDKPDVFDDTSYFKMEIKPNSSARKSIKESSDVAEKIASEIDKSYWIDKLIDDLDKHYESMEKAWLKNLDKLSDEEILDIVADCMGKSKTLDGKSEKLKNKMIDDLSKAYDDYIDDIDRQIRIGKSEDEIKDMIETTLEDDIKMYLKLAYNNKASSNYFMVKFAEDNLV